MPSRKARLPVLALGLLIALAAIWSLVWYGGLLLTRHHLGQWMSAEADRGRTWTCGEQNAFGFPFTLGITCKDARVSGTHAGKAFSATLPNLIARAEAQAPRTLLLEAIAPLNVDIEGQASAVSWQDLHTELRFGSGGPVAARLTGDKLAFTGKSLMPDGEIESIDHLSVDITQAADVTADQNAYDIAFTLAGVASPAVDSFIANGQATHLDGKGRLSQFSPFGNRPLEERLDEFRLLGGAFVINSLRFSKGDTTAEASGRLTLDESHRLAGDISARFAGIEPLLTRFGIPTGLTAIESLMRRRSPGADKTEPAGLRLPVTLRNGGVYIGPVRAPVRLRPLY
ncbi:MULTISPECIES: DUF2125 domain-containing protein [unclassified Beijerinckia]|uniref:DUF2125 domain-containing protein n=1 Tax=unclassified Beijerinckia TaxID=2638183 RepID=UPI0008947A74|nr:MULTISPECIES: DUF2125 domain-containing protein [unclassified Beijerinckia]MDH7798044.1 hypothetical protein [Beijerinckia sp. GAS462]SED07009.1 hypothetical protein SAMN05443249_4336 [Beijerinckia sp. 28-YEA-48]